MRILFWICLVIACLQAIFTFIFSGPADSIVFLIVAGFYLITQAVWASPRSTQKGKQIGASRKLRIVLRVTAVVLGILTSLYFLMFIWIFVPELADPELRADALWMELPLVVAYGLFCFTSLYVGRKGIQLRDNTSAQAQCPAPT